MSYSFEPKVYAASSTPITPAAGGYEEIERAKKINMND
jgi:hypothetical protein